MRNYTNNLISNIAGKKIIIAGINGYIGSEFSDQLNINNIKCIGIDKKTSINKDIFGFNLTNTKKVLDLIRLEKPDYFFHMGTHSALAYKNNLLNSFNEDNAALYNILTGLKKINNTKFIYFSSSYVYSGLDINKTVDENSNLKPSHNFGMSKYFFEQLIQREYSNSIILRLSSVFGHGNCIHPNAIEDMAKEASKNKLITIWGKGERKMQYVYIEDVIKYLIKTIDITPGIYNLGGHAYNTVIETANYITKYFHAKSKLLTDKKEGDTLPLMCNNKIIEGTGEDYYSDYNISLTKYLRYFQT